MKRATLTQLNEQIVRCRRCPRLVAHREQVAKIKRRAYRDQTYWAKPVPGFGSPKAAIVIIGLAPGAHGSNRTGRMFTGDASGDFLFRALHQAGLATQGTALSRKDGLELLDCYITAAVRCAPPENKPTAQERSNCRAYLAEELRLLKDARVYLCLGQIAFEELQKTLALGLGKFRHGGHFQNNGRHILCSYHVSRQNTQTGRLTSKMFAQVLATAKRLALLSALSTSLSLDVSDRRG